MNQTPLYIQAALTNDFKTINDMARTKLKDGGIRHRFNKDVMALLGKVRVTSTYITMVRKGKRHNQAIEEAIMEVANKRQFA